MPPASIRKAKRVTVLAKRTQHLRKYYRERSHKPLYDKLKSNNNYLAKALEHEKQNNQSLFSQNLAVIAELQNLNLACNKQNSVISNILSNAKEMLKMVVTMSSYVTSTISMCQELASSDATARMSSTSAGKKESSKRLSKSPTKGVVKPMVGGHTITKPTINLSRVNMNSINNISRLSNISENSEPSGDTPNNSQEINEGRSSIILPLPTTPLRYENGRACRMPERIAVSPPRISDTLSNEPVLRRRRSRHSKNLSESYSRSRSNRWSEINETPKNCSGYINIGSPRVKLKDVSKLLKDSHTINIRRLIDSKVNDTEIQESGDEASHNTPNKNAIISETQISINLDDDKTYAQKPKKEVNIQTSNKTSDKDFNRSLNIMEISKVPQSNARNWEEDPLEGPSWLFNNTVTMPSRDNESEELDQLNISDVNNNTPQIVYDESSDAESVEESSLPNLTQFVSNMQNLERNAPFVMDRTRCDLYSDDHDADGFHGTAAGISNHEKKISVEDNNEEDSVASFVTMRRGSSKPLEEEVEDFTLMLHQVKQNIQFNINELRLPEEECMSNSADNEIDSTITNTPISSMSNVNPRDSRNDQVMMKLPTEINNHDKSIATLERKNHSIKKGKKTKTPSQKNETNNVENIVAIIKNKKKQRSESENNRDPSAAKVVLEKLHDSHVKPKISLTDDADSRSSNHMRDATYSESSGESENSNSSNRPKRRKAPLNLKEPSLIKKLRRNQ